MTNNLIKTDFLVIGSGIAGLWFAYKASDYGQVIVLTKKEDTESNTNYAQGGIAAAFGEDDSPETHFRDTLKSGQGLAKPEIVRMVCEEGPKLVQELYEVGIQFTTYYNSSGRKHFDLGKEGGHSRARIVHAQDYTGREIENGLLKVLKEKCQFYEHHLAYDLILNEQQHCIGTWAIDTKSGQFRTFIAKVVVLATGGIGQVYLHTTNPPIATGDGIAMAYNAGAKIANMEFIQFHPTALYGHKINNRYFLISEAVRGEGGLLRNQDGKTFMEKYHELGCLAPRDVVARAIDNEMKKNNQDYVLLDITHLDPEKIKKRFPNIYNTCLSLGIDITKQPIPVVPAAHYVCGGIMINEWSETNIPNLFAIGECAYSGLHGANRLASNSLLEALVFAERSALRVIEKIKSDKLPKLENLQLSIFNDGRAFNISLKESQETLELTQRLRKIVWDGAGIVRSNQRLQNALEQIEIIEEQANKIQPLSPGTIELKNMIIVAQLIIQSAILRKESRGLHYNEDYPERDDEHFLKDTILQK
ncbi:MAG: L-aspartate oxidase [candidate division WOR-3 bacterium]|nr:L-aspartate oxidase [candidate division WOR-3 bacterium]